MPHIVICWELGEGLGHLISLSKIAGELTRQGHRVTCILKDISLANRLLGPINVRWLQAPRIYAGVKIPGPINHAEILFNTGYRDVDSITSLLIAWQTLFAALRPDRIICEYAPTAGLVGAALGIDVVAIDSGFSMPPLPDSPQTPLPAVRPLSEITPARLLASEQRTLGLVNQACVSAGIRELSHFSALFQVKVFYRNWSEFNHFGPHSPLRHMGQIMGESGGPRPRWTGRRPKVFAYLKPTHPESIKVLTAAIACGYEVVAYLPGFSPELVRQLTGSGRLTASEEPYSFADLPDDIDIGIWHSATGAIARCLDKCMRMIFLPMHPEQYLASMAVMNAGIPAYVSVKGEFWNKVFELVSSWPRRRLDGRWRPADVEHFAQRLATE